MDDEEFMTPERRKTLDREEAESRARAAVRAQKEAERQRMIEEERRAEERREKAERQRRLEEQRARQKQEEEYRRMGPDKILPLPPLPPSCLDDRDPKALKAWHLDDAASDPTLRMASLKPGRKKNTPNVSLSLLRELGIVYFKINLNDFTLVNQLVKERCYKHTDEIRVTQTGRDERYIERWFVEHFNEDENVRLITDGSCYYDVRTKADTWIRLHCQAGDMVVFPAGMYHRGVLDMDDFCATMRMFRDTQRWHAINRSEKRAENHPSRLQYLRMLKKGNVAAELGFK